MADPEPKAREGGQERRVGGSSKDDGSKFYVRESAGNKMTHNKAAYGRV